MCVCTPNKRTPWCGKPGCEMPEQKHRWPGFEPGCPLTIAGMTGALRLTHHSVLSDGVLSSVVISGTSDTRPV